MKPATRCTNCGTPIPANAPAGICPKCTFGLAMGGDQAPPRDALASTAMGASFVAPRPAELQQRFEKLEIIELLGHGGMGAVYKARQKNLDRIVALKILSPNLTNDPSFAQRFTREARTLAKLTHPNIVMVFEFGTVDDLHYLLMEFVDGVDLRTAMREGSLQADQALRVVQQVCQALQYAHDQGIVHRDIKPENILLGRKGAVKIADFGLAKLVQSETPEQSLTGTQQVVGTRNYMAPEQIESPTRVDHRADIYSLGVVFYELLTGELPLGRFAVPSEKAHVNSRLDDVVMRALEKEPDKRYQQASQVQTAVESVGAEPHAAAEPHPEKPAATQELRVPFSIPQIYGGFAVAHGIARFDGSQIELEFEVRDDVIGAVKSKPQRVSIPVNELCDAEFKTALLSGATRLVVSAAHLDTVHQIPNNKQGQFVLHFTKDNRGPAEDFADAIVQSIGSGPRPVDRVQTPAEPKKPWEKVFVFGIGASRYKKPRTESPLGKGHGQTSPLQPAGPLDRDEAALNMRGPALGLLATGVVNALVALGLWISFMVGALSWVGSLAESPSADSIPSSSVSASTGQQSEAESTEPTESLDEVNSMPQTEAGADSDIIPVRWLKSLVNRFEDFSFGTLIISAAMAVLLIFASVRMLQLKDYQFCVFAAVLAIIPLHGAALLGIGFGIWALVMLNKPEVKEAFSSAAQPAFAGPTPPAKDSIPEITLAGAMKAPLMAVLHIFKVVLLIGICLLFSFGLIFLITQFAGSRDNGEIRPEFRNSINAISDRVDEYEDQFEQRIDDYESAADGQWISTAADEVRGEFENQYAMIQAEINELKKTAESTAEFKKLNSRATRLLGHRNALKSRMLEIQAAFGADSKN